MALTLKELYSSNTNPFKLSLCAGQLGVRNGVSWIYMIEDEYVISYFHGSELAVTTAMKQEHNPHWLLNLVQLLFNEHAAGLIVNTGKFISEIPDEVKSFCNQNDFPLLTMPWEIKITEMVQSFCLNIINEKNDHALHDQALSDALLGHDNISEYSDTLARYYDLDGHFTVISIYAPFNYNNSQGIDESEATDNQRFTEYQLGNHLRKLRAQMHLPKTRFGLILYDNVQILIINNGAPQLLEGIRKIITEVYSEAFKSHNIFIGAGNEITSITRLNHSYHQASTAMRMAIDRNETIVFFKDMGIYKILFSIKDEQTLYEFADDILAPLDFYDSKGHNYTELLKSYIENDRSLADTAQSMYIHRNTVNYRIQKMKELLNSPLKTLEDFFPYQVALAIRDMQKHKLD